MSLTLLKSRGRILIGAVLISILSGCLSEAEFMTKDIGSVTASCNNDSTEFIVSLNNDDDKNGTATPKDRRLSWLVKDEDNLRVFEFIEVAGAAQVKIDEPKDAASENSVEGSRVRSWAEPSTAGEYNLAPLSLVVRQTSSRPY